MQELTLPVLQATVARAIETAADPDCDIEALVEVIRLSPELSAHLLKAVNSSYYGLRRQISSVDQAVSSTGIGTVRNILLCFGAQDLSPNHSTYPLEKFWEASVRRAVAAVTLAKRTGLKSPDNLFTIGLCQDLGLLAAIIDNTPLTAHLAEVVDHSTAERLALEESLGVSHAEIGAALFDRWGYPEDIIETVRYHHRPKDAPSVYCNFAKIANAAEALTDLVSLQHKQQSLTEAELAFESISLDAGILSEVVDEISQEVGKAAEMLNIKVGTQPSYQEIAKAAHAGLFAFNLSYESMTKELKDALIRQEKMSKRLEELNAALEHQAMTDKLTRLPNRRSFNENLDKELNRAGRIHEPYSLLLMDVDHFKRFNDTHGHQAGDLVLKTVGRTILRQVRTCDLPARYGGEEFAVIMPHTPLKGAQIAAERIRKAVAATSVSFEGKSLQVTMSIGITVIDKPSEKRAGVLALRRADDALYEAKSAGRNCVRVV